MGVLFQSRPSADNAWDAADRPLIIGGLVVVIAVLLACSVLVGLAALDVWSGVIVFLVIASAGVPVLRWVARQEGDPWLFKVLYGGLIAKLAMSMVRYFVIFVVYDGNGDAGVYHEAGTTFARRFAEGIPIHPLPVISSFPVETQWIGDITGVVYTITSPSAYAGFFVFSAICYAGQVLILRGFRAAVPEGDHRRFAVLVLLLPSLLFWPSSLGKEAIMIGCLGLVIYGGALLLAPRPKLRGAAFFALGTVPLAFIRPHIAYMSFAALGLAVALGIIGGGGLSGASVRGRAVRISGLVVLLALSSFVGTRMAERFADDTGSSSTQSTLAGTTAATSQGGSEFRPLQISNPAHLPLGVPSVVFRPLPWEARSVNALIAAVEGLLLLGLFAASWRRLLTFPLLALRRPFLVFVGAYVVVFSVGFSYVANFGILARQRTQMLPMVLVLLALPPARWVQQRGTARRHLVFGTEAASAVARSVPAAGRRAPDVAIGARPDSVVGVNGARDAGTAERAAWPS